MLFLLYPGIESAVSSARDLYLYVIALMILATFVNIGLSNHKPVFVRGKGPPKILDHIS